MLHALDAQYKSTCAQPLSGICRNLSSAILSGGVQLGGTSFNYEDGEVSFRDGGLGRLSAMEAGLAITSYQPGNMVMVSC